MLIFRLRILGFCRQLAHCTVGSDARFDQIHIRIFFFRLLVQALATYPRAIDLAIETRIWAIWWEEPRPNVGNKQENCHLYGNFSHFIITQSPTIWNITFWCCTPSFIPKWPEFFEFWVQFVIQLLQDGEILLFPSNLEVFFPSGCRNMAIC